MKTFHLGETESTLLTPPIEGDCLYTPLGLFILKRNGAGLLVAKNGVECHPAFIEGMTPLAVCEFINSHL